MNLSTFPSLISDRLLLRKIEVSDAPEILFLRSDSIVNQYIHRPENRKTKTIQDAIQHIHKVNTNTKDYSSIVWGITLKNESKLIGSICLWNFTENDSVAEVGYDLHPNFHKKGIMSEALKVVVEFGFTDIGLNRIEAFTHKENIGSRKLLEKCGFRVNPTKKDESNSHNVILEIIKKV